MNRARWVPLLFTILAILAPPARAQDKFALVIGITGYQEFDVSRRLRYADKDAQEFADFLRSPQGGFPAANVILLTNEKATYDSIIQSISYLRSRVRQSTNSLLYVFFSGHAMPDPDSYVYLMPYNADPSRPDARGLRIDQFHERLHDIGARYMILFADACYSGSILNRGQQGPVAQQGDENAGKGGDIVAAALMQNWAHAYEKESSQEGAFLSSSAAQESFEDTTLKHGLFSYYLLRGLRGAADSTRTAKTDGIITVDELKTFIGDSVEARSLARFNRKQTPVPPVAMSSSFPLAVYFLAAPARGSGRGNELARSGEAPRTAALLDAATEARLHFNEGYRLGEAKKFKEAATEYAAALKLDPRYAAARNNYGAMLMSLGDSAGAAAQYREAIALDPRYAMPHRNLATYLSARGDTAGAIGELRQSLVLDPWVKAGHILLGALLLEHGDAVGARYELELGTRADSTDAVNWVHYGQALRATNETDLALFAMRHGVDAMLKSPLVYSADWRAWALDLLGDGVVAVHNRSAALTWYRDALQAVPAQPYATSRLRVADSLTKTLTDSAAKLRLRLLLAPDDTNAYNAASTVFHEELLDPKGALEVTDRWLTRHPFDEGARLNRAENYFTAGRYAEADTAITTELAKPWLNPSQRIALEAVGIANDVALGRTIGIQARFASIYFQVLQQPDSFTVAWVFFGTRRAVRNDDRLSMARTQLLPLFSALGAPNKAAIRSRLDAARAGIMSIR